MPNTKVDDLIRLTQVALRAEASARKATIRQHEALDDLCAIVGGDRLGAIISAQKEIGRLLTLATDHA